MKSTSKIPWLLNAFTHSDEENMLKMFRAAADHVSLETIQNCDKEALRLFGDIAAFEKRLDANEVKVLAPSLATGMPVTT